MQGNPGTAPDECQVAAEDLERKGDGFDGDALRPHWFWSVYPLQVVWDLTK